MANATATTWIEERAKELGFAQCGVVRADKFPELERGGEWLARGYAGEMDYLSDPRRSNPQSVMTDLKSVIVCALTYNTEYLRTAEAFAHMRKEGVVDEPHGWISRYAWGNDYHEVLRGKLEALGGELRAHHTEPFEARVYADTGPISERVFAKYAGLGWLGKNTLLLNEELGSFFFLGVILTTLDLQPTLAASEAPPADRCGTCRRCIDACPTNALVEPYVMDARKCISYLTIELRGAIPVELREAMGQHVFGCDICQDVCPWNHYAPVTQASDFQPRVYPRAEPQVKMMQSTEREAVKEIVVATEAADVEALFLPRLEWLASLSVEEFKAVFRGSPIKRTKWRGLIRNVCIALGNSPVASGSATHTRVSGILSRLEKIAEPVIAESARWALSRIQADVSEWRTVNDRTTVAPAGLLPPLPE